MFDKIKKFEEELAEFAGAPYAVMTDCCTHAIELCLRYDRVRACKFTPYTYLSIPMTMHKLGIHYVYHDTEWQHWEGEYVSARYHAVLEFWSRQATTHWTWWCHLVR
jgi:dTDP-4-amino-4,6-dideoxygalactose transaminase